MSNIVLISTLDTKAEEAGYLRERIVENGFETLLMDVGYGRRPTEMHAEVDRGMILAASGTGPAELERLTAAQDRDGLSGMVCRGAVAKLRELIAAGGVGGVISIGGTSSAVMASAIMNEFSYAIPQLIFTTAASLPSSFRFFGPGGITVMHSLTEVGGLNYILKEQLRIAAGAICGMAAAAAGIDRSSKRGKRIAMTTNGWCENTARLLPEKLGDEFEVVRFHAIGQPEVVMEKLIESGDFDGVIDLVPSSITNARFAGTRISWDRRLTVAGERGVPQIIAPNLINVISRMREDTKEQREETSRRRHYYVDRLRVLLWLTGEELLDMAPAYAERINLSTGKAKFLFPSKGWLSIERDGSGLLDQDAENAFMEEMKRLLKPGIEVIEVDANIDDEAFADAVANELRGAL